LFTYNITSSHEARKEKKEKVSMVSHIKFNVLTGAIGQLELTLPLALGDDAS